MSSHLTQARSSPIRRTVHQVRRRTDGGSSPSKRAVSTALRGRLCSRHRRRPPSGAAPPRNPSCPAPAPCNKRTSSLSSSSPLFSLRLVHPQKPTKNRERPLRSLLLPRTCRILRYLFLCTLNVRPPPPLLPLSAVLSSICLTVSFVRSCNHGLHRG